MDIEFDFKGDPVGGVITKCKMITLLFFHNLKDFTSVLCI